MENTTKTPQELAESFESLLNFSAPKEYLSILDKLFYEFIGSSVNNNMKILDLSTQELENIKKLREFLTELN